MGSFAAQQFVLDHSHSIDGLALSGSGALDGLARLAQSISPGTDPMKLMNTAFEPARTPFDWLSRDDTEIDKFVNDSLCFPALKPESMQSFLDAFPRLADPREIRKVRDDLPVYIFSGSDDPVGQRLEGVRVLIDRYRSAGLTSIAKDFYSGGRHEMLHERNRRDVITNLLVWISGVLNKAR
jgi:alpha-beta hydrolase superfamily lysophospholipase